MAQAKKGVPKKAQKQSEGGFWKRPGILMPTQGHPAARIAKKTGQTRSVKSINMKLNTSSDDEEDETAELLRELEKIKRERAEKQAQEVLQLSIEAAYAIVDDRFRIARKQRRYKRRKSVTLPWGTRS